MIFLAASKATPSPILILLLHRHDDDWNAQTAAPQKFQFHYQQKESIPGRAPGGSPPRTSGAEEEEEVEAGAE